MSGSDPITRLNAALEGRYHIEREVGEGGMATVYLADDLKHERKVALKVLKPELAAVVGADRFLAEIRTTANLQHPHILPLFDSGKADSFLFYVMPYVEGETLRERLDREGQLPVERAVDIATKVADALQAAHELGVVHRDVKPANILLSRDEPLVADFGIALATGGTDRARLTNTGTSIGTPAYMSPEQGLEHAQIDARSDVYSLGCVLYEMLLGDPPFTGSNPLALLVRKSTETAPGLRAVRGTVSVGLEEIVLKALERVPSDRFADGAAFASALASAAVTDGRPRVSARRRVPMMGAALVVVLVAVSLAVRGRGVPGATGAGAPVVVVTEFRNTTGDPALGYIGEAVGRAVNDALTDLTMAEVLAFGADTALASYIVSGSYRQRGESVEFVTEITDKTDGRALAAPELVQAPLDDPLAGLEILGQRALATLNYYESYFGTAASSGKRPPSYEAYLAFDRGVRFQVSFVFDSAGFYLRRAIELESGYTEAYIMLGGGAMNNVPGAAAARGGLNGHWRAIDSLAQAMRVSITRWTEFDEVTAAYLEADASAEYDRALIAARRQSEYFPTANFGVGYAGMRANRPAEGLEGLEGLDPDRGWLREWPPYWHLRTALLHMLGRYAEELTQANRGVARFPGLQMPVARASVAVGSSSEVQQLAEAYPLDAVADIARLTFEMQVHGHEEAARTLARRYRGGVSEGPPEVDRRQRRWLAMVLPTIGETDQAIRILRELVDESPHRIDYEGRLAALLARRGDTAEAERISLRLASEDATLLRGLPTLWRARIAARLGRKEAAVGLLTQAHSEGATPYFVFPAGEAYWHSDPDLSLLIGYAPYDDLVRPR